MIKNRCNAGPSFELRNLMANLHQNGFSLLPLGGTDGKSPIVKDWANRSLSLKHVLGPMFGTGSLTYGVRLDGLLVIDCDIDDPNLVTSLEARFGPSPVHVKSPRGVHLYYRALVNSLPNLRGEGLPVDIKFGSNSYVAGPGSIRPDGGEYIQTKGCLANALLPLPIIEAPSTPSIHEGARHKWLLNKGKQMITYVQTKDELLTNLLSVRNTTCHNIASLPDTEVQGIVDWLWSCRLENRIFSKRDSAFYINRTSLSSLKGLPNHTDAVALYTVLVDFHGHTPGKLFSLNWSGMSRDGIIVMSRKRFTKARDALIQRGLLWKAQNHLAGTRHQRFALAQPISLRNNAPKLETIREKG